MDNQLANPYAAPSLTKDDSPRAIDKHTAADAAGFAKSNIVGLLLTVCGGVAFIFVRREIDKLLRNFELALPTITQIILNEGVVLAVLMALIGTFVGGIFIKPTKRSAMMGWLGIAGLIVAAALALIGLMLPLISLITSLT